MRFDGIPAAVLGKYVDATANRSGFAFCIVLSAGVGPPLTVSPPNPPCWLMLPTHPNPMPTHTTAPRRLRLFMVCPEWHRPGRMWSPDVEKDFGYPFFSCARHYQLSRRCSSGGGDRRPLMAPP